MTLVKVGRGYRLTDEHLRQYVERLVPGEIPPDAIISGVERDGETGVTTVLFTKLVDPSEPDPDFGAMRQVGPGAPIPTYYLGPEGEVS